MVTTKVDQKQVVTTKAHRVPKLQKQVVTTKAAKIASYLSQKQVVTTKADKKQVVITKAEQEVTTKAAK